MMIISGKWMFVNDEQVFRIKYTDGIKVYTALATGSTSWEIKQAIRK